MSYRNIELQFLSETCNETDRFLGCANIHIFLIIKNTSERFLFPCSGSFIRSVDGTSIIWGTFHTTVQWKWSQTTHLMGMISNEKCKHFPLHCQQTSWWMFYDNVQMFFLVCLTLVKQLENISSHISNTLFQGYGIIKCASQHLE